MEDLRALIGFLRNDDQTVLNILRTATGNPTLDDLDAFIEIQTVLKDKKAISNSAYRGLMLFNRFYDHQHEKLAKFIQRYDDLRYPIIGFLFTRSKARLIDSEIGKQLDLRSTIDTAEKISKALKVPIKKLFEE